MALQKTPVNLNLLSGADTKMNEQIDTTYKDMVNVVFSGDQTAKKMKGYDLLATLPVGEKYSAIFTRRDELLAQTDKGSYKYYENPGIISKIDSIGSTEVDQLSSYGQVTVVSDNYIMHVAITVEGNMDSGGTIQISRNFIYTFTDKAGNVLNKIEIPCRIPSSFEDDAHVFRWVDGKALGDSFFASGYNTTGIFTLNKFTYDAPTNTFVVGATYTSAFLYSLIRGFDMLVTPNELIYIIKTQEISSPGSGLYRLNLNLVFQSTVPFYSNGFSEIAETSLYLFERNAGTFYATATTDNGVVATSVLYLSYYDKTTLALGGVSAVASSGASKTTKYVHFLPYPTSDTTAYAMMYEISTIPNTYNAATTFSPCLRTFSYYNNGNIFQSSPGLNLQGIEGLMPISKIFIENGEYYHFAISQLGLNSIFHVIRVKDGAPVATFCATKRPQANGSTVLTLWNLKWDDVATWYSCGMRTAYKIDDKWLMSVRKMLTLAQSQYADTAFYSVEFDASRNNTQLEIVGNSNIFNGQPAYYDGKDLSEFGFLNRPLLMGAGTQGVGTLRTIPVGDYQLCAIYKWTDASGNIFYSDLSNITGIINIPAQAPGTYNQINVQIYAPGVTTKENLQVQLYIKKSDEQFRLYTTFAYEKGQTREIEGLFITQGVASYPTGPGVQFLPFTGTFVAGGDYPTSPLTNSIASAIYEDRVFSISKDNPISLAYSQQKLLGIGTEFNQDIFYIDVYDKRGVNEDDLSGIIAMDGRLFIFKERSILYIVGSGPSRANTGDDISSPQLVTTDVGCISAKSLVLVPSGIMFMSDKGIYLLDRKLQVQYLGANVERFNSNTVTSAILLEKVNEVRFTTLEGEILVYNYLSNAWSWFTNLPAVGACIWKGKYTLLLTDGRVFAENQTHYKIVQNGVSTEIIQTISSPWIRGEQIQAWEKIYEALILGYYKTPHQLKIQVYYDYELFVSEEYIINPLSPTDYNILVRPTNQELESGAKTNGVYQMRIDMIRKNCQAFRLVIQDIPDSVASNTGECFALSNISITIGAKKGYAKLPAAKSH